MNPSSDQLKSAGRTLIATLGGVLAGWAIGKGWITEAQASAILSNQEFMSAATVIILACVGSVGSVAAGMWGLVAHKQANLVATVAAMPEVAKVETVSTAAGINLASAATAAANVAFGADRAAPSPTIIAVAGGYQ
jgi:hypothetical protein